MEEKEIIEFLKSFYKLYPDVKDLEQFSRIKEELTEKGYFIENGYGHFLHCPSGMVITLEE